MKYYSNHDTVGTVRPQFKTEMLVFCFCIALRIIMISQKQYGGNIARVWSFKDFFFYHNLNSLREEKNININFMCTFIESYIETS